MRAGAKFLHLYFLYIHCSVRNLQNNRNFEDKPRRMNIELLKQTGLINRGLSVAGS